MRRFSCCGELSSRTTPSFSRDANGSTGAYQDLAASGRNVIIVPARGLLPGVRHWLNRAAHWLKTLH